MGLVNGDEPFKKLLTQGMVLKDGTKMSKSKGNTVDPQKYIDHYGADTIRLYMMFTAPPEQSLEWSDSAIEGASRFLKKFWRLCENRINTDYQNIPRDFQQSHLDLRAKTHNTIKKVTTDYEDRNSFNTVIAAIMELINAIPEEFKSSEATSTDIFCLNEVINVSLQMLSPIVPHITFDIWTCFNPHLDQNSSKNHGPRSIKN